MSRRTKRRLARLVMWAGVVLAVASAGPLGWGFGALVGAAWIVTGWQMLADTRAEKARTGRYETRGQ